MRKSLILLLLLSPSLAAMSALAQTQAAPADNQDPSRHSSPDTAGASEPEAPRAPVLPGQAPTLDLERLLTPRARPQVPDPDPASAGRPGGKDRETWQREFAQLRDEVSQLEQKVEETKARLRESASDDWGYSPTGGGLPTDPEVLRLRAELKRDRQSLEAAERRLRDLQVEASLAGVPDPWKSRQP